MRKSLLILLGTLMVLSACGGGDKRPKVFLNEPQMVDVMADTYLIEAQLNQMKTSGTDVSGLQKAYYDQLFAHHGITDSIFEENMDYYTRHPDILERVMDSVTTRFAKAQQ